MEKDIGRKALYFLSPLNTFCCSPVKKNDKNNKMKMKMAWLRRFLKNGFIHCYIDLKLTSGAFKSPKSLVRILLWLWLLFKWSLGVCSIRNTMGDLYYAPLPWYCT